MFCSSCGTERASAAKFCHQCGQQINVGQALKEVASSLDIEKLITVFPQGISLQRQGRSKGGSWGARDPPLQAFFFKKTTYNIPWRKRHDDNV